ncbi:MAG: HNH endonuclease [Humibacter sp.]
MKRAVRQRTGFGCVICGHPITQYEHIIPWAEVKAHDVANITLLCWNHHGEVTKGLLSKTAVREHDRDPHNLKRGRTTPYPLPFDRAHSPRFLLGGHEFRAPAGATKFFPVVIDNEPQMRIDAENGRAVLTLTLRDQQDRPILSVHRNELRVNVGAFDYRVEGQEFRIDEARRGTVLRMRYEHEQNAIQIEQAVFRARGVEFQVRDGAPIHTASASGARVNVNGSIIGQVGIALGKYSLGMGAAIWNEDPARQPHPAGERAFGRVSPPSGTL